MLLPTGYEQVLASPLWQCCNVHVQRRGELALIAEAGKHSLNQVDKLYWDGEVVQKTRKKDHKLKAEQLWKVTATALGQHLRLPHEALQLKQ